MRYKGIMHLERKENTVVYIKFIMISNQSSTKTTEKQVVLLPTYVEDNRFSYLPVSNVL